MIRSRATQKRERVARGIRAAIVRGDYLPCSSVSLLLIDGACGLDIEVVASVAGDDEVPHSPLVDLGVVPPSVVASVPFEALRRSPVSRRFAGIIFIQIRIPEQVATGGMDDLGADDGLLVRSYRLVSWWTKTALAFSDWSLPVRMSLARTVSPCTTTKQGEIRLPN